MTDANTIPFRRVGIVGFGLMGGSLGRALKALPEPPHVRAMAGNPVDLNAGMEAGALDLGVLKEEDFLPELDLLVYATPLQATLELMEAHAPLLDPDTLITDVVSLKVPLQARMEELGLADRFVGSHPMAGGEGWGFEASRPRLFRDATVWMVPGAAKEEAVEGVKALWKAVEARPRTVDAAAHDRLMVWVSHLPQLTANALAMALEGSEFGRGDLGPGGRDMTRLAGSSPEMWTDLLSSSGEAAALALDALQAQLDVLKQHLRAGEVDEIAAHMEATRRWMEEEE